MEPILSFHTVSLDSITSPYNSTSPVALAFLPFQLLSSCLPKLDTILFFTSSQQSSVQIILC